MDTYDALNSRYGVHKYRITLMDGEYSGHITSSVGGNTKGAAILTHALDFFECGYGKFTSDCEFAFDDENESFCSFTLHDKDGNELEYEDFDISDVVDMVVAVEIVGYKPND